MQMAVKTQPESVVDSIKDTVEEPEGTSPFPAE